MIGVLTRSFDQFRSGANLAETVLTPAAVQARGITHLGDLVLQDDARGAESQPLVVQNLLMADGLTHEVCFVSTMANDCYAFDTTTFEVLWKQRLGNPVLGVRAIDMFLINTNWGITSTGCIDTGSGRWFVVAMHSPDGTIGAARLYLHALHLVDGSAAAMPLNVSAATYQPPDGLPMQYLDARPRKQRAALAFDGQTIFVCCGSFNENDQNQGWVIACDVLGPSLELAAAWSSSARYSGGGIWMAGQGPAIDGDGRLKLVTGNGAFDGITEFGNCLLTLTYQPAAMWHPASLTCTDYVAFYTDTGLVGGDPTMADVSLIPGYSQGHAMLPTNARQFNDQDLGSGGALHLPATSTGFVEDLDLVCGKDGRSFLVNAKAMGKPALSSFAKSTMATVYACAVAPIGWFTYWQPGNATPADVTELDVLYGGKSHHLHSTAVHYESAAIGTMIFCWGENGNLRAWQLVEKADGTYALQYLACSAETASVDSTGYGGGMPGGMLTVAAAGSAGGIVVATIPYGNANSEITDGRLLIYATDAVAGGTMTPLWDSERWGITFKFNKFNLPFALGGKIYVPTYDARIMIFG